MITSRKSPKRKKVNFMIDEEIIVQMAQWIPAGERSDFVNKALDEAMEDRARQIASDAMDEFRKKHKWKMTEKEIRKAINYGRK